MRIIDVLKPMKVAMIRTPVVGPAPANTLAYISGLARGDNVPGVSGRWDRVALRIRTSFRIDGYTQANHAWHEANTLVSATAMLRWLETSVDMTFGFGIDRVSHFIDDDGTLGFMFEQSLLGAPDTLFSRESIALNYALSAWILLFEPVTQMPPAGLQRPQSLAMAMAPSLGAEFSAKADPRQPAREAVAGEDGLAVAGGNVRNC
jgi:hypothetical protein